MKEIAVRPLTPLLLQDWLAFFDHEAFTDDPKWASCYCHFYHADHEAKDWEARSGKENREASTALVHARRLNGYLAYEGHHAIGWCNAAPRLQIPNLQQDEFLAVDDADRVGSIVCFVVAKPYRRRGVARKLLEAACSGFASQGLAFAEAYPRMNAVADASNYHGPLSLYLEAGFTRFRESEKFVVVRKPLEPRASGVSAS